MMINFWDCDHGYADKTNIGDCGNSDLVYYCDHKKGNGYCILENKWSGDESNCCLLDNDYVPEPPAEPVFKLGDN